MTDDPKFEANRVLARKLYVELMTRITTQPLHFMHGVEDTALQSVVDFFRLARTAIVDAGPNATIVGDLATDLLNKAIRPFTAHWHKSVSDGYFDKEDTRSNFRKQMRKLQSLLSQYAQKLKEISLCNDLKGITDLCSSWQCPEWKSTVVVFNDQPIPQDRILSFKASNNVQNSRLEKEKAAIKGLRRELGRAEQEPLAGLAISGGGLRSATFSLGVLQGLVKKQSLFPRFDYLSTVSGGGYLGSLLTTLINSSADYDLQNKGFGRTEHCETDVLRHLRAHSKFLIAGGWSKRLHIPVLAVYGWICTAAILLPIFAVASLAILALSLWLAGPTSMTNAMHGSFPYALEGNIQPFLICFTLIAPFILFPFLRWINPVYFKSDSMLTKLGWVLIGLTVVCMSLLLPLLEFILVRIQHFFGGGLNWAVLGTVATAFAPVISEMRKRSKKGSISHVVANVLLTTLPFILLLVGALGWISISQTEYRVWIICACVLVGSVMTWPFLDINDFSLHPFYRSRLAQAYLVRPNSTGKLQGGTKVKLSESRIEKSRAPYHIINAALNAGDSTAPEIRGRVADFFEFGPDYCGAESVGYCPTTEYEKKTNEDLDLATAMAISGGAASPCMGVNSSATKFLFALLNIRLDYWLRVPSRCPTWKDKAPSQLIRQMLGMLDENQATINLSDGGHIENLGVYTLLKRRCKLIVAIDGECDPQFSCSSLIQAIRYAEIDYGIKVDIDLNRLKPALWDKAAEAESAAGRSSFTRYHFSLGTITYVPDGSGTTHMGYLLYIKNSMTGNEPDMLMRYKLKHSDFPHQSTGDLFYNEEQFECYRALGEHIVEDIVDFAGVSTAGSAKGPLVDLFESLHQKLYDPAKN